MRNGKKMKSNPKQNKVTYYYYFYKRPFKIMVTKLIAISHIDTLSVNAFVNASIGSFSLNVTVTEQIPTIYTTFGVNLQTERSAYDLVVLNRSKDFCSFYKNPKSEPLLDIMYTEASSYGRIPQKCPIEIVSYL